MAREINIGDKVAIFATVGKRIEDRVTLHRVTGLHFLLAGLTMPIAAFAQGEVSVE
jgi:hypothetical protein